MLCSSLPRRGLPMFAASRVLRWAQETSALLILRHASGTLRRGTASNAGSVLACSRNAIACTSLTSEMSDVTECGVCGPSLIKVAFWASIPLTMMFLFLIHLIQRGTNRQRLRIWNKPHDPLTLWRTRRNTCVAARACMDGAYMVLIEIAVAN